MDGYEDGTNNELLHQMAGLSPEERRSNNYLLGLIKVRLEQALEQSGGGGVVDGELRFDDELTLKAADHNDFGTGYLFLTSDAEDGSIKAIAVPGRFQIYSQTGEDGSGNWHPAMEFGTANSEDELAFFGNVRIANSLVPANASAAGSTGQIAWDTNFFYVCVANGTWKRTPLETW